MWCRSALAVAALLAAGACGSSASSTASTGSTTAKLAMVEAAHLCDVQTTNARTESELTDGLVARLKAVGLDYPAWQTWHASLLHSSARADELARAIRRSPCPAQES